MLQSTTTKGPASDEAPSRTVARDPARGRGVRRRIQRIGRRLRRLRVGRHERHRASQGEPGRAQGRHVGVVRAHGGREARRQPPGCRGRRRAPPGAVEPQPEGAGRQGRRSGRRQVRRPLRTQLHGRVVLRRGALARRQDGLHPDADAARPGLEVDRYLQADVLLRLLERLARTRASSS